MADDLKTNNNERHEVEILIEPEIKGKWLSKIITWNKLFTISHLRTKLFLKITIRGQNIPSSLMLSGLHLHDRKGYCFKLEKQFPLKGLRSNKVIKTESFKIVFPYSGQFWLDVNIKTESTHLILRFIRHFNGFQADIKWLRKDRSHARYGTLSTCFGT